MGFFYKAVDRLVIRLFDFFTST